MKSTVRFAILGASLLAGIAHIVAEEEESPANKLYQQAVVESDRAVKLEHRGKKEAALDAYELSGKFAEASIAEAERTGIAEQDRPPEIYFRCAASFLHAGRLLTALKREGDRKDEDLRKAILHLGSVEKLERARAERMHQPLNPELWRVQNAAGYACFLHGDLAEARLHYGAVLEMNPSYHPAEQAIAEINNLEQQQNELFTPQGRTYQKEKNRRFLRGIVDTLKLVKDIIPFGL